MMEVANQVINDEDADANTPLDELEQVCPPDTKLEISPATAIAAMGLNLSLKYHGIATVQDGALYQQLKLEGANIVPLRLQNILDTAKIFEEHILSAPNRLTAMVYNVIVEGVLGDSVDDNDSGEISDEDRNNSDEDTTV